MNRKGLIIGLIIDDDPLVCKVLEKILHQRGIEAILATDSRKAQKTLEEHAEDLAIAIVDLLIPGGGLTGWDIIAYMKQHEETADIPIIVLTGVMISPKEQAKLEQHVSAVVRKWDFDLKSFGKILDKLLSGDNSA